MVQIGWDGQEYGLIPLGDRRRGVVSVAEEMFPEFILEQGLGHRRDVPRERGGRQHLRARRTGAKGWLFKYLHQRFFRLSDDGIDVLVRVPSGDEPDWPRYADEAADASARGRREVVQPLAGRRHRRAIWDDAADRQGNDFRGDRRACRRRRRPTCPRRRMHWWVLPSGPGTDVSSRTASGGSIAVLYQNELHDWRMSNQANPFFARLGVIFGKPRVGFVLEPLGDDDHVGLRAGARARRRQPVFESDAWPSGRSSSARRCRTRSGRR